jgi:N-acyl-D-amino-acid deacylase
VSALALRGGLVADGSGGAPRPGDVFASGGLLVEAAPGGRSDRIELDCDGLVVAPGFIDTHTHSDLAVFDDPNLPFKTRQGVCCDVLGQDGVSVAPLRAEDVDEVRRQLAGLNGDPLHLKWDWRTVGEYLAKLQAAGPAIDLAYLVPHGQVRRAVLGMSDRRPTELELDRMCAVLDQGLADGAVGFSTGLIYPPCCYAETPELTALCRVVAARGGVFVVHIRSESDYALESVAEVIAVARESGCRLCISHIKLAGERNWGKLSGLIDAVREAREEGVAVTADQYPYTAGSTMMGAILPPWAHAGGEVLGRLRTPALRARMRAEILGAPPQRWDNFWSWGGAEGIRIADIPRADSPYRHLIGRSLAEAAGGRDPLDFALDLLAAEEMGVAMVAFSQSEEVIRSLYREPWVGVCTDGLVGGRPHPRTYSAFARALRWLVREEALVGLGEAVRKMTALPAESFRLRGLGWIAPGYRANLVAFDPAAVTDRGTYDDPTHFPDGIMHLVVGGRVVIRDGIPTGDRGGKILLSE